MKSDKVSQLMQQCGLSEVGEPHKMLRFAELVEAESIIQTMRTFVENATPPSRIELMRIVQHCGLDISVFDQNKLTMFATIISEMERRRHVVWVKEVESTLRLTLSKISRTLSEHEADLF